MTIDIKTAAGYADRVGDIEHEISAQWDAEKLSKTNLDTSNPKHRYVVGMFPYPSGNAHMGHVRVYTLTDTIARMGRFKGEEVFNPLGWDAFGLPAENAALKNNVHPGDWTEKNIAKMRDEQFSLLGFSFDHSNEINTSSSDFYRWTQSLFLKLYENDLVYRSSAWVNWDPVDKTVLANEQVIDGKGWRTGAPVEKRKMDQWFIRITDFAEDLWKGLDELKGWSKEAISAQKSWIGRTQGQQIDFAVSGSSDKVSVFTSTPELMYGATAVVLTAEHPDVLKLSLPFNAKDIESLRERTTQRGDSDRRSGDIDSLPTGRFVIHPLTGQSLPLLVSSTPAALNGVDATLCIPAHNANDAVLAKKHGLPVVSVIHDEGVGPGVKKNTLINSSAFNGLTTDEAGPKIAASLLESGQAREETKYRLRDWAVGRQRFWGAPIPMLHGADGWEPVPESRLPVELPKQVDFSRNGQSLLARHVNDNKTTDSQGRPATLESDTMDTFMCSSWYVWRFLDAHNKKEGWQKERADKWMPVDYYVGGLEHANQHLIYFRFMSHFLHSIGMTPTKEPVKGFVDNGLVLLGGEKMSKSKGNTVAPDEVIANYGADALRLYILADTPHNQDVEWNENGVKAKAKFLNTIYDTYNQLSGALPKVAFREVPRADDDVSRNFLRDVAKSQETFENHIDRSHSFNGALAELHAFGSKLRKYTSEDAAKPQPDVLAFGAQTYLKLLGTIAPHIADHLWRATFDQKTSIFKEPLVQIDEKSYAPNRTPTHVDVLIQVNGKKRGQYAVDPKASDAQITSDFQEGGTDLVDRLTAGKKPDRVIIVRQKDNQAVSLINLVVA